MSEQNMIPDSDYHDPFLEGNEQIELAIHACYTEPSHERITEVLTAVYMRLHDDGHFILPVDSFLDEEGNQSFGFKTIQLDNGTMAIPAFTSKAIFSKAPKSDALSHFIDVVLTAVRDNPQFSGLLLNPWGESFLLDQGMISALLRPETRKKEMHPYLAELDAMDQPYVNAHINNISFPTDIEGLETFVYENQRFNVEEVLLETDTNWTVPRSAKIGDIVFFFHAKTAISRITALITKVNALPYDTAHDKVLLLEWLERARQLYKQYGGKIFAVGRVTGCPEYLPGDEASNPYHWHGRIYADVGDIVVLENPIDINEFNDFIKVSRQSAITPLPGKEFNNLRDVIWGKNSNLPDYLLKCEIGNFDLSHINGENFMEVTQEYRRRFLLEIDFRSYYVDYFLRGLVKRKFWQECVCYTSDKPHYFVDNVFFYNGKYYLLEVKLNVLLEQDLKGQLRQYIGADYLYLDKEAKKIDDFERSFMYVIDTEAFYRYDVTSDTLVELIRLDDVYCIEDISKHLI